VQPLQLRPELRLQGRLRLQQAGPPLSWPPAPRPEPVSPVRLRTLPGKDVVMRMLYTMAGAFALTVGLRIVDPPAASAVTPPAAARPSHGLVLSVPRAGSHRADPGETRKSRRP
jgi:hypothetical protein